MSAAKHTKHLVVLFFAASFLYRKILQATKRVNIGFLVEEFFDEKFRGFGGYGMTIKYIAEHFNKIPNSAIRADVLLTHRMDIEAPQTASANAADVVLMPKGMKDQGESFHKYCRMIHNKNFNVFIGVDHFITYEYPLMSFPNIPWVLWLKDPRDVGKWEKIASVSLVKKSWGIHSDADYKQYVRNRLESFQRIYKRSRMFGRKIVIATEANDFISIGKNLCGLKELRPAFLSKPIPLPVMKGPEYSDHPSFLFLARLDPIKRPWIFCELAKRFPKAEFLVAGQANMPEIMDPVLAPYRNIPNLKFLGRVFGPEKDKLFRKVWAVINTSAHEGLPVSIVEGFSYGKTAIASENPDEVTSKYGLWVGDMRGDGFDTKTVDLYAKHVEDIINGKMDRAKIFQRNREYIGTVHSFEKFEATINDIVLTNKYDNGFTIDPKYKVT
jgi:glycosyltransferase involved in cell wall biosynthesis